MKRGDVRWKWLPLTSVKSIKEKPPTRRQHFPFSFMSNVFEFRDGLISDYSRFSTSFANIAAPDIKDFVKKESDEGRFWPDPILQLNANYLRDKDVNELYR